MRKLFAPLCVLGVIAIAPNLWADMMIPITGTLMGSTQREISISGSGANINISFVSNLMGTQSFARFNPSLGTLTGVDVNVIIPRDGAPYYFPGGSLSASVRGTFPDIQLPIGGGTSTALARSRELPILSTICPCLVWIWPILVHGIVD